MGHVLTNLDMRSLALTPTLANGQSVAVPDDWFVDVWYRDANGRERHKGIGVRSDKLAQENRATAEEKAIGYAVRSLCLREPAAVLHTTACRLFEHGIFRSKAGDRHPTLDQMAQRWFR